MKLKNLLIIIVSTICFMLKVGSADATTLEIKKVEKGTSNYYIADASLTLSKKNTESGVTSWNDVQTWTTVYDKKTIEVEPGTYRLSENHTASGYIPVKDQEFVVTDSSKPVVITSESDYTKISIAAMNYTIGPQRIGGVHFQLVDSNGSVIRDWISTKETPHLFNRIPIGTYKLKVIPSSEIPAVEDTTIVVDQTSANLKSFLIEIPAKTYTKDPNKITNDKITNVPNTSSSYSIALYGIGLLIIICGTRLVFKRCK